MKFRIWASVVTFGPGRYSSPMVMLFMFYHAYLVRLKPARATSTSACAVSQFGLMRGGSMVSGDVIVTFPREIGATRELSIESYCSRRGDPLPCSWCCTPCIHHHLGTRLQASRWGTSIRHPTLLVKICYGTPVGPFQRRGTQSL